MDDLTRFKTQLLAAFECQKSGNCCRRDGKVVVTLPELIQMAAYLKISPEDFTQRFVKRENGWSVIASVSHRPSCFLSSDQRCSIYPVRPEACKTYPHWPEIWESHTSVLEEISLCPGLKKAFDQVSQAQLAESSGSTAQSHL